MKSRAEHPASLRLFVVTLLSSFSTLASSALVIPEAPLIASQVAPPMTMLVSGKDHKFFYEAYNDASDIDEDGTLDTYFKPSIVYYGLFDSGLCYEYKSGSSRFEPSGTATFEGAIAGTTKYTVNGKCPGKWSGNWLNYMTTSRIDALRKVLYGGYREIDSASETVLRRAYIPQDAHSWGKEYHSSQGYLISDYTPYSQPTDDNTRHFFGSLTPNRSTNCSTLDSCSKIKPVLRVRTNVGSNYRVWQWASKERPVLESKLAQGSGEVGFPSGTGSQTDYAVRVLTCTATYHDGCKQYPNASYKPVGLLHDYGESEAMYFGLLTGSYDQHLSGGRLRKVISSFTDEVTPNTGEFKSSAKIVNTFNNLRIRGFNQSTSSGEYWKNSPYTASAKEPTEGEFVDWGNPIAEMLYEATRYLAGLGAPTTTFNSTTTIDGQVGLSSADWDNPYDSGSSAKAPWCAKSNFLTISDINPSFDSDQIPGSYFASFSGDLPGLSVTTLSDTITAVENDIKGLRFIGQSEGFQDSAPTPKDVKSLSSIRGLSPEEPTKKGSYYSAAMSYYAKSVGFKPDGTHKQTVDTYVVALSSPLPRISAKLPNGKVITLVPFSKTISGSGVSSKKGDYQPTNQIVDFYVEQIANSSTGDADPTINDGRYYARFQINFEDVEQGGDHDMDAISQYVVQANADNTLSVTVTPTYQAGGMQQNMGYVISGSTHDGVYLVARDESGSGAYFLNVPSGQLPGYCDASPVPSSCSSLPSIGDTPSTFVFTPSSTPSATLLKDPLWYAAKWGGFVDKNGNGSPDLASEWDTDGNSTPDTYFLVQNPLKLKESLKKSFDTIVARNASSGNITSNSTQVTADTRIFQSVFNSGTWDGELKAYFITGSTVATTPVWEASANIPSASSRKIFTWKDATTKGVEFKTLSDLSASEQTALGSQAVLDYIRGDQSKEIQNSGGYRNRKKLLGDIVDSTPYYVKDTGTVYVGANDGMLHAFSASNGKELFAYIPSMLFDKLANLASPSYPHTYFVDGDVAVSTLSQTTDKNLLIGALGRGGKGVFALDVTKPDTFSSSNVLWEYAGTSDDDMGYVLGRPIIAKVKSGETVAIVANGYNSTKGDAVLYVFNLKTGSLMKTIATGTTGGNNGLSNPTAWDENNDGVVDYVFAGDLQGHVWKFDLTDSATSKWNISYAGKPLFSATDSGGKAQPITGAMSIAVDTDAASATNGSTFVFFGTGSYITSSDPADKSVQTWYGIIDGGTISGRSKLKERTFVVKEAYIDGQNSSKVLSRSIAAAASNDMKGQSGWYIDLVDTSARGERIVSSPILINALKPVLEVSSIIPQIGDPCDPKGTGFVNFVNPFTGAQLDFVFIDMNGDGKFDSLDMINGEFPSSIDPGVDMPGQPVLVGTTNVVGGTSGKIVTLNKNFGGKKVTGRMSWREIISE